MQKLFDARLAEIATFEPYSPCPAILQPLPTPYCPCSLTLLPWSSVSDYLQAVYPAMPTFWCNMSTHTQVLRAAGLVIFLNSKQFSICWFAVYPALFLLKQRERTERERERERERECEIEREETQRQREGTLSVTEKQTRSYWWFETEKAAYIFHSSHKNRKLDSELDSILPYAFVDGWQQSRRGRRYCS